MAKTTTKSRRQRCRWCNKHLDSPKHRRITESYCFVRNQKEIRSSLRPRIGKVGEAYENGKLRPDLTGTDIEDMLLKRQYRLALNASLGLDAPKNLKYILEQEFIFSQVVHEKPWAVMWLSDGKRKRKRFNSLWGAIEFWNKARRLNPSASVVSLVRAYELPAEWRTKKDKLPKKWRWCPYCVNFRVFKRVHPQQIFTANVKYETVDKKGNPKFEWAVRRLALTECQLCGCTNRHPTMRRANLPYELRTAKPGRRKMKPRKGAPRARDRRRKS